MLNELITWVLNTYLGKYLEDLNPAQLSTALISGEVELENVPIRKDALRSFGISVETISGIIGKIKLQIPVRQFRTSPWCIIIERVYGVFAPKDLNEWDNEKEKQGEYNYKLNLLDSKEASWRLENGCNMESYYSLSYSSWLNYGTTLATNILENLELKITDVHLRYEDALSRPTCPFSAGIRIKSISVQTCDENWTAASKNNNINNISYKLLELEDLCFYWDKINDNNMCSTFNSKDLLININNLCKEEDHNFIINPINATAKFKRERCKNAIRSKSRPRVCCDVVLPQVIIELNKLQYNEIVKCMSFLQDIKLKRSLKISRPTVSIENNAKLWWKHAANCHGFYFRSSDEKWKIAKDNTHYIKIYTRLLINPSESLSKDDRQLKTEMERLRSLEELQFLRQISYMYVSTKGLNLKHVNQSKGILFHWFPNLLGWYGNTTAANDELYEKMEDDILNAIKETIENDSFPNRDAIFANCTFSLSDGKILLTSGQTKKDVSLELEFQNLISYVEVKPKLSSYRIGISLGLVSLKDKLMELTEFPYIIRPQIPDNENMQCDFGSMEPWFQMKYEKNSWDHQSDYRLTINSKSLDVVYSEFSYKRLVNFFTESLGNLKEDSHLITQRQLNTRLKFLRNWKKVLIGQKDYRKKWFFEVNVSAPRIIFVENLEDKNTSLFMVDFGRFQLYKNEKEIKSFNQLEGNEATDESEDELFMTPCSTPPGSKISPSISHINTMAETFAIQEELTSSRIVINKDTGLENNLDGEIYDKYIINLNEMQVFICKKNSPTFNLLDKFNISIQFEKRIVDKSDPEYPAIKLFGNLHKIVAHINEQKVTESLKILNEIKFNTSKQTRFPDISPSSMSYGESLFGNNNDAGETSNDITFQFVIDQMIVEIQTKEKSIAEVQIIGAQAGILKRKGEISINMGVHGFLLVDAIQSLGPDFELLIASHRNFEMDNVSATLKQSDHCASTSPQSCGRTEKSTTKQIINKAMSDLQLGNECDFNSGALITIELNIIEHSDGVEPIFIANITFNNLDVIANQETIVELLGIGKRVCDNYKRFQSFLRTADEEKKTTTPTEPTSVDSATTKVNFDFHRLNVLVLRREKFENKNFGRKIGTLTLTEAKIQAKLGNDVCVRGALGGIQIIDVTSESFSHQRIFSVGMDPFRDPSFLLKNDTLHSLTKETIKISDDTFQSRNALSFKISQIQNSKIDVNVRMASVWYCHSPKFVEEIYLCVKEFEQHFKNFVKSIRDKATHMAKGFVHHISSAHRNNNRPRDITLDVILSTPVLVLPRSCEREEVLVANLGKITIYNTCARSESYLEILTRYTYFIDIKNVNLYSINNIDGNILRPQMSPKSEEVNSYQNEATAILYDTALLFQCKYETISQQGNNLDKDHTLEIKGSVTESFNICLTKSQYEQLKDTIFYATDITLLRKGIKEADLVNLQEDEDLTLPKSNTFNKISFQFSVPIFKIDLKNEHNTSVIRITFQEFSFYQRDFAEIRECQLFLRSVIMEDLKCITNSKYRNIVDSSTDLDNNGRLFGNNLSTSCPNLLDNKRYENLHNSLSIPSNLNETKISNLQVKSLNKKVFRKIDIEINENINTKNLVIYKSVTTKSADGRTPDKIKSSIDFNSLNLIISTDKWFLVFDFFGLVTNDEEKSQEPNNQTLSKSKPVSKMNAKITIRSLNLIMVKNESELFKANISCVILRFSTSNVIESIDGRLGSISLYDLTPYGYFYRERFCTSGSEALSFKYKRENLRDESPYSRPLEKDANLIIFMSSVKYVHTKRFIVELHFFVQELLQLQSPVMKQLKKSETKDSRNKSVKIGLEIHAESPIILLPVSYNSNHLLIADLGKLKLVNSFHYAKNLTCIDENRGDLNTYNEIVELMNIDLVNINFLTGECENSNERSHIVKTNCNVLHIGDFITVKLGNPIFREKCRLKLNVIRNTHSDKNHNIPDVKIEGTLSQLHGLVNLQQYKLIRGFLNNNLGEPIDDVYYNFQVNLSESIEKLCSVTKLNVVHKKQSSRKTLSISFLLENVIISLTESIELNSQNLDSAFACINFIKSSLDIDSFNDGSQDIDLILREILVMDVREHFPDSASKNVFKYILRPSVQSVSKNLVQAEFHCRKQNSVSKYTVLLNNMRIMAILDYLEKLKNFLEEDSFVSAEIIKRAHSPRKGNNLTPQDTFKIYDCLESQLTYEFVLNITNSEIVFVENNEQTDTEAVILKSTTVFSYKPNKALNRISIDINHLEIFSCILGSENVSSQSIIDPFTLNMELRNNCFQIHAQNKIFLRISYHDAMLFSRIMQSIPKQTHNQVLKNCNQRKDFEKIAPLVAMGFKYSECWLAMEVNSFNINEAAIWLSQQKYKRLSRALKVNSITFNAASISTCIIDDCLDADVPVLEVTLSNLKFTQNMQTKKEKIFIISEGEIDAAIACDYYNRRLSGWEPTIEPWTCKSLWKYSKCSVTEKICLSVQASSSHVLKLNATSTLLELFDLVHKNWTEDYLKRSLNKNYISGSNTNIRKRLPFVPFALKNLTGEPLIFKTFPSHAGITRTEVTKQDLMCNWISAEPEELISFDFGPQNKLRHSDSHKLNMHQILVQIHGWTLIGPISIDKVGTFFRYASQDMQYSKKTRIVFDISLMGSAQKLIVVRSALNIVNKTVTTFSLSLNLKNQKESLLKKINPLEKLTIPLRFVDSAIYLRPHPMVKSNDMEEDGFCPRAIQWTNCFSSDCVQGIHSCYTTNRTPFHVLAEIKRDKYPVRENLPMPGHTITIIPPLKLKNLLCCDLVYKIAGHAQGRLNASEETEIYTIDINESFCLSITLDNYRLSGQLKIPMGHTGIVEPRLKLVDTFNRELFLRISIQSHQGKGMEIAIAAPIWLINKTGLPLVFRQESSSFIASGQFEEHENAREVSPLLFSFSDQEGSPFIEFRLGKCFGDNNKWCKSFGINKEMYSREVMAEQSNVVYVIGVNVQRGTSLYACTTFVTLTPRFQLYNKSKHRLEFAQKCDIKEMRITSADKVINALPESNFPFHWSSCEQEPLLCVRLADEIYSHWSCGLPVNEAKSVYINLRSDIGEMNFLRLEVALHGGTYILHFTDAYTLPPPIRIDNYSEVSVHFSQKCVVPHWRTHIKPQSSLAYALDDPLGMQTLLLEVPGGNFIEFPIVKKNVSESITYANFIYIAFKETFRNILSENDDQTVGIEGQQLVLGVKDRRVIITKKCSGDRSQLWLMNSYGQLEHEGSSPPTEFSKPAHKTPRLVLDLEKPPNPAEFTRLVVRPQNNQRATTQTWRFENRRLMCHANMCVQAANGIYGLQPGYDAVLGKTETSSNNLNCSNHIPFEQSIEIQKLRPGSGQLEVIRKMDGPIKCIQIHDVKVNSDEIVLQPDPLWNHASIFNKPVNDNTKTNIVKELMVKVVLSKGLGVSIVTRSPCEELAYISLEDIVLNIMLSTPTKLIDLKVGDMQIDNQLLDSQCPTVLHTLKSNAENVNKEALALKTKLLQSPNKNAVIFECFTLQVKPCSVILEERFILRTALFLDFKRHGQREDQENYNNLYRIYEYPFSKDTKRFYFEEFSIGSTQIRLSFLTASKLRPELLEIKKRLGIALIKFEDAVIEFDKFSDRHHFETLEVYLKAMKTHYLNQLKWHAASILGSVDFLGNPLGFANDLSEGVSGLIFEGSVKSLVKNVTHGLSNSTAKLTETLSDNLGRVVLDDHDNEMRQKILQVAHPSSGNHLVAGFKGLGFGLLGGVTSIFRQTYIGAQSDGLPGFFSGLGRGIVGTVTKPLIGVLDLASETASAVRETSRGSHHYLPDRKRLPRCVTGAPGGLLPFYSYRQAKGQQYLFIINGRNFVEKLIFYEPNLCNDKEAQLRLLVSTEYVRIFSMYEEEPAIMFECHLSEVLSCHPLTTNTTSSKVLPNFYIEISTNVPKVTRPRVRCQSEEISERASRCINYAKTVFEERELSVANF